MDNLTFKPMEPSHLDDVYKIEAESYGEHHWSRASFLSEIKNDVATYICAFLNDKLVGYCGVWKVFEEAHITTLAIDPLHRGKKIAQALLVQQIKKLYTQMVKYITLEVRVSNAAAIKLYEKFGFKSLGIRKNYYQNNNEDALIMWTNNIFSDDFKLLYNEISEEIKSKFLIFDK